MKSYLKSHFKLLYSYITWIWSYYFLYQNFEIWSCFALHPDWPRAQFVKSFISLHTVGWCCPLPSRPVPPWPSHAPLFHRCVVIVEDDKLVRHSLVCVCSSCHIVIMTMWHDGCCCLISIVIVGQRKQSFWMLVPHLEACLVYRG